LDETLASNLDDIEDVVFDDKVSAPKEIVLLRRENHNPQKDRYSIEVHRIGFQQRHTKVL